MKTHEASDFYGLIAEMATIFGKKIDPDIPKRYFEILKDLPFEVIESMAKEHMRDGKFFPKPRDLRPREARKSADSDERGSGKFPELYTPAWWSGRAQVLRTLSKNRPEPEKLHLLTLATFDHDPMPDEIEEANRCYDQAWPAAPTPSWA